MKKIRSYTELSSLPDFKTRYEYLKIGGVVGESSFGFDRYLNQELYSSREWRKARDIVLIRDGGCDLGLEDFSIGHKPIVHHMNPITAEDIETANPDIYNPEYLICVSQNTHNAIHFGDASLLPKPMCERQPGDTCPWR